MRVLVILTIASILNLEAGLWEDIKNKTSEYYEKTKEFDEEHNISNRIKHKTSEYYKKTKEFDEEHNISNRVKHKASEYYEKIKSIL